MLKRVPSLKHNADALTEAMVGFYCESQKHFTAEMQPHYIYSPRELTRWKTAIYEALDGVECLEDLVRLYVHEGLRLFEDRLVLPEEKVWCNEAIDGFARNCFPACNHDKALVRPMFFTTWTTQTYQSIERSELKAYVE
jgi:dynein heavy chain 1